MFDHVTIRVSDREVSERFYSTVLGAIGIEQTSSDELLPEWNDFSLAPASDDVPPTTGLHIGFSAGSRALVDEFWRAGTEAGYRDAGAPGPRPQYHHDYYGAFLLDPDGNSAEAVHLGIERPGNIDHLWIRVADLDASRCFYDLVSHHTGFGLRRQLQQLAQFAGVGASFSVVRGTPSRNTHMAFAAGDDADVDAFHRAATEAGYRHNGAPGERPIYHAGYYGAYVLDPDGNNVEVVNHNRRKEA